jgi:hypothetical protein
MISNYIKCIKHSEENYDKKTDILKIA